MLRLQTNLKALLLIGLIFEIAQPLPALGNQENSDLDQLIRMASSNSLEIKKAKTELAQMEQEKKQAWKALYLPRLDLKASAYENKTSNGPVTKTGSDLDRPRTYGTTLSLSQNIFRGFGDSAAYDEAQLNLQKSALSIKEQTRSLTRQVRDQYSKILSLSFQSTLLNRALSEDSSLLRIMDKQYKKGYRTKSEKDLQHLNYLQNEIRLRTVSRKLKESEIILSKLTMDPKFSLKSLTSNKDKLKLKLSKYAEKICDQIKKSGTAKSNQIYQTNYRVNNPKLKKLSLDQTLILAKKRQKLAQYSPELSFKVDWNYHSVENREIDPQDPVSMVLNFNYPIFSSLDRVHESSLFDKKRLTQSIETKIQVRNADKKIATLVNKLSSDHETHGFLIRRQKIRLELFLDTKRRYKNGTSNIRNLLEDRVRLQGDQIALAKNINDIEMSINELDYLSGSDD